MPIDTSMYQNMLRPPKSVAEYDAEAMQGQQNRLALQLEQNKAAEFQRNIASENKLSQLLAAGGDPAAVTNGLASAGYGSKALAYTKTQQDLKKGAADVGHIDAQTGKLKQETTGLDYDQREKKRTKAITDIAAFTTPQEAMASLKAHADAGDIAPEQAQMIAQGIPQNPADFPKWQIGMLQRIMSAKDVMGQLAPDANVVLTAKTSRDNNAATVGATIRGQNLTDVRSREANQNARGQITQTDAGTMLVDPRTGQATPVTLAGQPLGAKLKEIPASVNTAIIANSQSLSQLDKTIALLEGKSISGQAGDSAATGIKGYLPQQVLNAIDPQGIDARAGVADIGSLKLHDRSGAAVTASESPRLMPFIPLATDSNATALKKLKRLKQEVESESAAMGDTYSKEQGYRPNPVLARNATPPAGKPSLSDIFGK